MTRELKIAVSDHKVDMMNFTKFCKLSVKFWLKETVVGGLIWGTSRLSKIINQPLAVFLFGHVSILWMTIRIISLQIKLLQPFELFIS